MSVGMNKYSHVRIKRVIIGAPVNREFNKDAYFSYLRSRIKEPLDLHSTEAL